MPGRVQRAQRAGGDPRRARARRRRRRRSPRRCRAIGRVPGRFEPVDEGQDFAVVVDYSHTPDSLENVLRAARDLAGGARVICVFGCGGDRDRAQAPAHGRGSPTSSPTCAIVTSDNPRSEDPEAIIREILAAMRRPGVARRPARGDRARDRPPRAGRRRRHRRQGPRAGPGVRGRPQGAVRRRRRSRGRRCARARVDALSRSPRPRGARLVAPAPHAAGPDARGHRLARGRARRPLRRARGENVDGGRVRRAGARAGRVGRLVADAERAASPGALLAADDPLAALQRLATAWRRALGAQVIGVTGSTGKTSTKDLSPRWSASRRATVATHANLNTEIGLPLTVLGAPAGTEVLVLEMAMRGPGQIAELATIAEPDVGADHERRPGPPRADGLARGDRRREGRAHRRPEARRHRGRPARRAAARAAPARRHHGRRRSAPATTSATSTLPTSARQRPHAAQRRGRAGRRARRRRRAARPRRGRAERPARPADRAARRGDHRQRLLQRQPDVDAGRPRRPRRPRPPAGASPCSATCSSSGPTSERFHRGDRRARARARRRPARHRRPARRARWTATRRSPTPPRPPRCCPSCSRTATPCSSRARAASGLEVVAEALADRPGPSAWARSSSAAPPPCSSASS